MQLRTRVVVTVGVIMTLGLLPLLTAGETGEHAFGTPEFQEVWERNDLPIAQGVDSRTWLWGPHANTPVLQEPYEEADGGMRDVQYTDKSRMEMPVHPVDPGSDWFITQGLLATELMTGNMQLGDATFVQHDPSEAYVAGDPSNNQSPTYAQMGQLIDEPPRAGGEVITEMIQSDGSITDDPGLAGHGVTDAQHVGQTDNNIASVFWDFMNSTGTIYHDGQYGEGPVFTNPFYAIGFPITEAYWGNVTVGEQPQQVLIQCFERRCLTFTPDNDPAWQVESGNIGQHYYDWRYGMPHYPDDDDTPPAADDTDDGASDDDPPPQDPEPTSASSEVGHDSRYVGEDHIIEVTVLSGTDPYQGAEVRAEVASSTGDQQEHVGTQLTPDPATTGEDGVATLGYVGVESGIDTVTVSVDGLTQTHSVDVEWDDDVPGTTSCVVHGESIQEAIDAASPGDEICVESGVYAETITIDDDMNDLHLKGKPGAVMTGQDVEVGSAIYVRGDNVTVSGLEIRDFPGTGIRLSGSDHTTLRDLELIDNEGSSIRIESSLNVDISDVTISMEEDPEDWPYGIYVVASQSFTIRNVSTTGGDYGINLGEAGGDDENSGTIENTTVKGAERGINVRAADDLTIQDSVLADNSMGGLRFFMSVDEIDVTITNNEIVDNSNNGISFGFAGSVDASISGNLISGHNTGFYITPDLDDLSGVSVNLNDFIGNNEAIRNNSPDTLNATMNYWGHHSGPGGSGSGDGDPISGSGDTDYQPVHHTPITE